MVDFDSLRIAQPWWFFPVNPTMRGELGARVDNLLIALPGDCESHCPPRQKLQGSFGFWNIIALACWEKFSWTAEWLRVSARLFEGSDPQVLQMLYVCVRNFPVVALFDTLVRENPSPPCETFFLFFFLFVSVPLYPTWFFHHSRAVRLCNLRLLPREFPAAGHGDRESKHDPACASCTFAPYTARWGSSYHPPFDTGPCEFHTVGWSIESVEGGRRRERSHW